MPSPDALTRLAAVDAQVGQAASAAGGLVDGAQGSSSAALASLSRHASSLQSALGAWPASPARASIITATASTRLLGIPPTPDRDRVVVARTLSQIQSALDTSIRATRAAATAITAFNQQLTTAVSDLNGDAALIEDELRSQTQQLTDDRRAIEDQRRKQRSAEYQIGEFFKGIVSLGIWSAIDFKNAIDDVNSLASQIQFITERLDALNQASQRLKTLVDVMCNLEGVVLNLVTAMDVSNSKVQTAISVLQQAPDITDPFFQAAWSELATDLDQVRAQAQTISG